MTGSPEYSTWKNMRQRCFNPKATKFECYGGRGITVCDRWRYSFLAFYADMGPRPTLAHSIDRYPNGDGNYDPGNCRWATQLEQMANSSHAPGCSLAFTCEHCGHVCLHERTRDQYRACPACECINAPVVIRNYTGRVE